MHGSISTHDQRGVGGVFLFKDDPDFSARLLVGTKRFVAKLLEVAATAKMDALSLEEEYVPATVDTIAGKTEDGHAAIQRSESIASGDFSSKVNALFEL